MGSQTRRARREVGYAAALWSRALFTVLVKLVFFSAFANEFYASMAKMRCSPR